MNKQTPLVFASDLDNTLIYSHKVICGEAVCVELYEGSPCTYMGNKAHALLAQLRQSGDVLFVPVTTRSLAQYGRIGLPGPTPRYALVANGGILLEEGRQSPAWRQETEALVKPAAGQLHKALELLERCENTGVTPRWVDELFVFAKPAEVEAAKAALRKALDESLVTVESVGQKLYVLPHGLDKGTALGRLRKKLGAGAAVVAAGDSAFDIPLLLQADEALIPKDEPALAGLCGKAGVQVLPGPRLEFGEKALAWVMAKSAEKFWGIAPKKPE